MSKSKKAPNEKPFKDQAPLNLENVPPELIEAIESIPIEKRQQLLLAMTVSERTSTFKGPVPHPDIAKGWNEAAPEGADRLLKMAEHQLGHRSGMETLAITEQLKQSGRGQIFAFILGLAGMLLATVLAITGHDWVAGTFATTLILGLVTVFITGKRTQKKELEKKA